MTENTLIVEGRRNVGSSNNLPGPRIVAYARMIPGTGAHGIPRRGMALVRVDV